MKTVRSVLDSIKHDIEVAERDLAMMPVTDNFGSEQITKIQAKYKAFLEDFSSPDASVARQMLSNFNNECIIYRGAIA